MRFPRLLPLSLLASLFGAALVGCANDVDVGDEGSIMGAGALDDSTDTAAMSSRCAGGEGTIKGIDVSYYQGTINWSRVKQDGVKYAFIRVSDGTGFRDSKFDANWRGAKTAGVMRGVYQFFRADEDPIAQADLLISKVGGRLQPGDLPPVIDVESADGQSRATIVRKVRAWLDRVESRLGVKPIVYTGPYFWRDVVGGADVNDHPLWVAHYGTSCPLVPPTWTRWTFHQHTSSGRVDGIGGNVDMNRFNGSMDDLRALAVGGDVPARCLSGDFDGEYCDDDNQPNEGAHDRLKNELGVDFHCADKAGEPAYCPTDNATRAQTIFVLGKANGIPLAGHPNAFRDDNDHPRERYMDAAKAFGIYQGNGDREGRPDGLVTRDTLATVLVRMFRLPATNRDYFSDDDGNANEAVHNKVAAAGLFAGYDDGRGGKKFNGADRATRSTLAVVAVRAFDRGLVPVWDIPEACLSGTYEGAFCDDEGSTSAQHHDRLVTELGVSFACRELDGEPAFCPSRQATRADVIYVFGDAAGMPLDGHPDAFDDDDNLRERYFDAAKAFGIMTGYAGGEVRPRNIATRDTLAVVLSRMYALPDSDEDFFSDDDGSAQERWHNKVGAAGLFTGYDDGNGGRKFDGDREATRSMLALLAVRAHDLGLTPVWE